MTRDRVDGLAGPLVRPAAPAAAHHLPAATAVTYMTCAVMRTAGPVLFRAVELRIEGKKGVCEPVGRFHRCVVPDAVEGDSSHVLGDLP